MYTPKPFSFDNASEIEGFISENSFATLISCEESEPLITHAPLIRLSNKALVGHFASSNPHAQIKSGSSITAIFHGAHAYISPKYYKSEFNVPTWNYICVHCKGKIEFIDSDELSWNYFKEMVEFYEEENDWTLPEEERYKKLLSLIRFFKITNETFHGKAKLSQNKTQEDIRSVINNLEKPNQYEISKAMKDFNSF